MLQTLLVFLQERFWTFLLKSKMGSSPSKRKSSSKSDGAESQNAPPAAAPQAGVGSKPAEVESKCLSAEEKENEPPPPAEEQPAKQSDNSPLASITSGTHNTQVFKEEEVKVSAHSVDDGVLQTEKIKKMEKRKKNKGKRRSSEKKKSFTIPAKVDFPPQMVRAHQAAYSFLNPNISKYETLLGLLDQAAQTQLSLQPMMSALVLRFEEINQALEEMAEEGELMLKEHGDYMALPSGMLGPAGMQTKFGGTTARPPEPPPDLLQQLLQHSTEKMRLVGGSVQALGDTTLEEAVEYFSSLSKLLFEKLQAKQTAEQRLTQVLAQVEGAAMRKSILEDTALHSEDSGIGGENESLPGSERHRSHRGSAGSGSCGSGNNVRCVFDIQSGNLPNLEDDEDEEDDDDDDEDYEDDEADGPERKRSNSSPPDPCQALLYLREKYMQEWQASGKQPLPAITASKVENSSSARCVNVLMELQRSQRDLDQQLAKMAQFRAYKEAAGPHFNPYKVGFRRHSLSGSASTQKGPLRTNQSPAPRPPKRPSVRRLINTFSQGVDGRPGQSLANVPPFISRHRKSRVLMLSETGSGADVGSALAGNSGWPDSRDDLDVDSLPPPPPEVLMDDSFQTTEVLPGTGLRTQEDSVRGLPVIHQNSGISQRLRASVQNVEVLPNRSSVKPSSTNVLAARPMRQDAVMGVQDAEQPDTNMDPDLEKANALYQQARKIIHLCNPAEMTSQKMNEFYDGEVASSSLPVTAPPVSRVRLPPSCPSVCQRFPSPPVIRPPTASRSSSRPGSPRTVTRASDKNVEEIVPSVSFRDARSVFCMKDSQNTNVTPGSSVLPRPWGESSRGRLNTRGTDNSTRRTQSEQRPGLTSHSEFSKDGRSALRQAKEE